MPIERYADLIQPILNEYSGSASSLREKMEEMSLCKEQVDKVSADSELLGKTEEEKTELREKYLQSYDTFIKTQEYANKLFERFDDTIKKCSRTRISEEAYETIKNLGMDAKGLSKKELALITVREHLIDLKEILSTRITDINKQVSEVAISINQLIYKLDGTTAAWSELLSNYWTLGRHYENWKNQTTADQKGESEEKAAENPRNWTLKIERNMADSAVFEKPEESFKKRHKALLTLNLTYIDPTTNKGYGVKPLPDKKFEIKILENTESETEEEIFTTFSSDISDDESPKLELEGTSSSPFEDESPEVLKIITQNYTEENVSSSAEKRKEEIFPVSGKEAESGESSSLLPVETFVKKKEEKEKVASSSRNLGQALQTGNARNRRRKASKNKARKEALELS